MPFTFSHPAILVPVVRVLKKKVSLTGLAIGSVIPDAEYFIRMHSLSEWGHSWAGIFWFDLPMGIGIAFLFHNLIRNHFIQALPRYLQLRLQGYLSFNWNAWFRRKWPIIFLCLIGGSASHIIWDRFTHHIANLIANRAENYSPLGGDEDFLIYYLFFGLNSLAGLALLAWHVKRLPVRYSYGLTKSRVSYWRFSAMVALAVFWMRVITGGDLSVLTYIDSAISAMLIGVIAASVREDMKLGFRKRLMKQRR